MKTLDRHKLEIDKEAWSNIFRWRGAFTPGLVRTGRIGQALGS